MQALLKEIDRIIRSHGCEMYGFADISGLAGEELSGYDHALSLIMQMEPSVMAELHHGPTTAYTVLYTQVNLRIDALAAELTRALIRAGYSAWALPASIRSDPINIRGDFQHKTAATRSGLGWIGRNCQLVTKKWGPWVRLGTVLTDAPFEPGKPMERSLCGKCMECVNSCPADALKGGDWRPGVERDVILDAWACDAYKKDNFSGHHGGHTCGICTNACPMGRKQLEP